MNRSFTLSFQGKKSEMTCTIFPPIELHGQAEIALLSLQAYSSYPNIHDGNNVLRVIIPDGIAKHSYKNDYIDITVPVGSYEIRDIESFLQNQFKEQLPPGDGIWVTANATSLKTEVSSSRDIDFDVPNSIAPFLGFEKKRLKSERVHVSDHLAAVNSLLCIRVGCSIATGAYVNGTNTHEIYEFYPSQPPGYKITESSLHLIYYPVLVRQIDCVTLTLTDQNGRLIDFRGEPISVRLHVRTVL